MGYIKVQPKCPYPRTRGVMIETEFVVSAHSAKHHTLCCHKHRTLGDSFTALTYESNLHNSPLTNKPRPTQERKSFTLHIKHSRCRTIHHKTRRHRPPLHRHLVSLHQCLSPTTKQQAAAPHLQTYHSQCPLQSSWQIFLAMLAPHLQLQVASRRTRS